MLDSHIEVGPRYVNVNCNDERSGAANGTNNKALLTSLLQKTAKHLLSV